MTKHTIISGTVKTETKCGQLNNGAPLLVKPVSACENVGLKIRGTASYSHFMGEGIATPRNHSPKPASLWPSQGFNQAVFLGVEQGSRKMLVGRGGGGSGGVALTAEASRERRGLA